MRPIVKLLYFEAALKLDDGVEDALHDVGVDEVAVGFDNFRRGAVT